MIRNELVHHGHRYRRAHQDLVLALERETLGTDYGANGYTTLDQGNRLGVLLELDVDDVLLDIGSGCGWPGLHLARKHRCRVIGVDPVIEGAAVARRRAMEDEMAEGALAVVGDGTGLPVRDRSIDAIVHSDML
jgi:methylase of polypeptide subunit release factors